MSDMKSCPFCGASPELRTAMGESWVHCVSCDTSGRAATHAGAAITAWNTRALSAPSPSADALRPGEWEPIESAPKDGTKLLIWCRYGAGVGEWKGVHYNRSTRRYDPDWADGPHVLPDATHWMPLPAPPTTPKIVEKSPDEPLPPAGGRE